MARWWTQPPIMIAALGVFAVILTALLSRTTITQQTSGAGSPAIGRGRDITITPQPMPPPPAGQSPATPPSHPAPPPVTPPPPGPPWWQQPPVIAAIIAAIATLVAALIQRARAPAPAKPQTRRQRPKS